MKYVIFGLLIYSSFALSMELTSVNKKAGLFDLLSKDISKPLFASIQPRQINCLRKSCQKLSELFSFRNPSLEFILCKNPHINKKDWESILITSLYGSEKKHDNEIYKAITEQKKCKNTEEILKKFNEMLVIPNNYNNPEEYSEEYYYSYYLTTSLGVACMSRNSGKIVQEIKKLHDDSVGDPLLLSLRIVVANRDNKSLLAILQSIKISWDIKSHGTSLIKHAYDYFNKGAVRLLLQYKCYDDLNEEIMEEIPSKKSVRDLYNFDWDGEKIVQRMTLLDRMLEDHEPCTVKERQVRMRIQNLLRGKGAKTAAELEFVKEKQKKAEENKERQDKESCSIQ